MPQPTTAVSRLREKQSTSRDELYALLDCTPLVTIAFVRDGHPMALPIGFARIDDELVIHGSTGSPFLRDLAAGAPAAASVTTLEGVVVARSGFESSFRYRSAVIYGPFAPVSGGEKTRYVQTLTETFIPGRVAEMRPSTKRELAATRVLRLAITEENWSLKISDGWSEDPEEDIAAGTWAGVVPIETSYGQPLRAPDCPGSIPVPESVRRMSGPVVNRRR